MKIGFHYRAAVLAALLFAALPARAEDPAPASPQAAAAPSPVSTASDALPSEAAQEHAEIKVATPTPAEGEFVPDTNPDGTVEPLDPWYVRPDESQTPTPEPQPSLTAGGSGAAGEEELADDEEFVDEDEEEEEEEEESAVVELESVETDAQLPEDAANKAALMREQKPRRIQLTKAQKKRMRDARVTRWRIMREKAKALGLHHNVAGDPRGEPEIRICSLNMNNYGPSDDYRKILKASKLPQRLLVESSSLRAISETGCDIVALQRILGLSDVRAQEGVQRLIKKLTKVTGGEWKSFLGKSEGDLLRNGFIYRADRMVVKKSVSYNDVPFTTFGPFQLKKFKRAPAQITVLVQGKGKAKEQELILLTYQFRNGFVVSEKEPETARMQMADAVRQIIHTEEKNYPREAPQPIVVLLGDRVGPQQAPATQLLEGRSRLVNFTQNGGCTLSPENTVTCKNPVVHTKEFFGVTAEGFISVGKVKTQKSEDGAEKRVLVYPPKEAEAKKRSPLRKKTVEIYLQGPDLPYALAKWQKPGRYTSGVVKVKNGLPLSPLVWVELNW